MSLFDEYWKQNLESQKLAMEEIDDSNTEIDHGDICLSENDLIWLHEMNISMGE